jgi:hypothetical protein
MAMLVQPPVRPPHSCDTKTRARPGPDVSRLTGISGLALVLYAAGMIFAADLSQLIKQASPAYEWLGTLVLARSPSGSA